MFKASASLFLGIMFVIIGAVNVWLILQASTRVKNARAGARLIAAHRIGGYIFILLYCLMGWFMIARMRESSGAASAGTMIHMTVAMLLSPLLFVKVLIARYYKSYYGFLLPIGLLIFVLSFVLVAIAAGPYLIRNTNIRSVSSSEPSWRNCGPDWIISNITFYSRSHPRNGLDPKGALTGSSSSARPKNLARVTFLFAAQAHLWIPPARFLPSWASHLKGLFGRTLVVV